MILFRDDEPNSDEGRMILFRDNESNMNTKFPKEPKSNIKFLSARDASLIGLIFQLEGGPLRNRLIERLSADGKKYYDECMRNPSLLKQLTVSEKTKSPHHC